MTCEVCHFGLLVPVLQLQQLEPSSCVADASRTLDLVHLAWHQVSPTSIVVANCGDCRCAAFLVLRGPSKSFLI